MPADVSTRLRRLVDADQTDRSAHMPPEQTVRRDAIRKAETYRILASESELDAADLARAALILHHGINADDAVMAHLVAGAAVLAGSHTAACLLGPTLDRMLHQLAQPQALGTQYLTGVLCAVRGGRIRSVDPAAGVDMTAQLSDGVLAEDSILLVGDGKWTTEPVRCDVPPRVREIYQQYPL